MRDENGDDRVVRELSPGELAANSLRGLVIAGIDEGDLALTHRKHGHADGAVLHNPDVVEFGSVLNRLPAQNPRADDARGSQGQYNNRDSRPLED